MNYAYWAGCEADFDNLSTIRASIATAIAAGRFSNGPRPDDFEPLWYKVGSTAVIDVKGSLVEGSAGWGRLWGVLGYDDIAQAALTAAADPEVTHMMWHITSPGGEVAGLADFGALVSKISASKPSAAHASSQAGSAGYWIMSAVNGLKTAGSTAEVGSIGVLQIAKEYSKQLAEAGVTVKVLRSADMKARMNPFEELSADAEDHARAQLADLHDMFVAQVKAGRPNMTADQVKKATDGRTFIGKRAMQAGLVDRVSNFEQALKLLDKDSGKKHTSSNSKGASMKIILNDQQIAAIAGGATLASLGFTDEQVAAHNAAMQAEPAAAPVVAPAAEPVVAAPAVAAAPAAAAPDVLATLLSRVEAQATELASVSAALTTAKASMTSMQATHDGLLAIAREATAKMLIPMGGSAAVTAAMDAPTVVTEYAKTKASFEAAFPIGGVAKPGASATPANPQVPPQFAQLARQNAAAK